MPSRSFDSHLEEVRRDPRMAAMVDEESRRLQAAVALMRAREAAGLTQQQLADLADVSRVTVSRIERGRISPSFRTLGVLAAAMGKRLTVSIG